MSCKQINIQSYIACVTYHMIIISVSHRPACRHVQIHPKSAVSSNEMFGKRTRVRVLATFNVCVCDEGALGGGAGPTETPVYVQAVSNKLLNLIKRSGVILRSPEGPWTSAVMNMFCLIMTPWVLAAVTGTTFSKIKLGAGVTSVQTEY